MTEINIGLFEEVLLWATDEYEKQCNGEPSEWAQGTWASHNDSVSCGTACCIAGKVAMLSDKYQIQWSSYGDPLLVNTWGGHETFSDVGTVELGLTDFAEYTSSPVLTRSSTDFSLFDGDNALSDLWRWAYRATEGKLDVPADRAWLAIRSVHERALEENRDLGRVAVVSYCSCGSGDCPTYSA